MKAARNQFILFGFIGQAWTWDPYFMPLAAFVLWFAGLKLHAKNIRSGPAFEAALLLVGCGAAYGFGALAGQNTHFFIGHGLTLFQAARLTRELNRTEKIFSIVIACLQVSVACAAIFDYRILLILIGTLVTLPGALIEIASEAFGVSPRTVPLARGTRLVLGTVMVVFFLFFPRAFLNSPFQARSYQQGGEGSLADYVLDPSRSGSLLSGRVILQIEGDNLGYLRCLALVDYDGLRWSSERSPPVKRIPFVSRDQAGSYPHRRVRVKQVAVLGRVLPTDGMIVHLSGQFFRRPLMNSYEIIECDAVWNTPNNVYEYWIDPRPKLEKFSPTQRQRYLQYPLQSGRLRAWLEETVAPAAEPLQQARLLENWLRNNLNYRIGAPELNRLSPVEDFLFNQREGHCERFAATLALLLRMKDIPSRIVIGYVPGGRNWFSGGYNIRFRDAHAWTEAYFPELGWVAFDGTPRATIPLMSSTVSDLVETLDFFWYSNVINFDLPTQKQLFKSLMHWAKIPGWTRGAYVLWLLLVLLIVVMVRRGRRTKSRPRRGRPGETNLATGYYQSLLKVLAKRGITRQASQSPLELANQLRREPPPGLELESVDLITSMFCRTRYGHYELTEAQQAAVETALQNVEKPKPT